ncbi:hypothetical protein KSP35_00420 [Aquihabitans sp. G128]|uniref:hypothetical protein n=1 Tax=Aquihabitans sp. G128 TaxID=2849779 RepID=UPI001C22A80E|nr:hypothetical protein [Aquihabitans sp. G128]QXC61356.1 hypothetical protein KSP35_00420 [Aquihabitans sp. G128]
MKSEMDEPGASLVSTLGAAARAQGVDGPRNVRALRAAEPWSSAWLRGTRIDWSAGIETDAFGMPSGIATNIPTSTDACELKLDLVRTSAGSRIAYVLTHANGLLRAERATVSNGASAALVAPWTTLPDWISGDACLVPDTSAGELHLRGTIAVISFFEGIFAGAQDLGGVQSRARVVAAALRTMDERWAS